MPTPVGFAEIAIEYVHSADPEPWYTVFGVEVDLSLNSAQEHLDHAAAVWYTAWQNSLGNAVRLNNAIGRFGQDAGGDLVLETLVGALQGLGGDTKLPQNCAMLVRKQTSLGGRQGRGRFFMPAVLNDGDVNEVGIIAGALVTGYQTLVSDLLDDLAAADPVSGATTPMVLLHGPKQSTGVTPPPTTVDALTVDSRIATQRRRLRK